MGPTPVSSSRLRTDRPTRPTPPDSVGLRYFTIVLPHQAELDRLVGRLQQAGIPVEPVEAGVLTRDPSRNGMLLALPSA